MSKEVGLDRAIAYQQKLESFRKAFQKAHNAQSEYLTKNPEAVEIETGRKYDKVYINTGAQKLGRYMVDRNSWAIYGIKSWQQVNERRQYGSLDTIAEWNWGPFFASPIAGTAAEKAHAIREADIVKNHRPRGRPRKS